MASLLAKLRKLARRHFLRQAAKDFDRAARRGFTGRVPLIEHGFGRDSAPYRPAKGAAVKTDRGKSLARPIAAALRDQGYTAAVADKAARDARGSDFNSRLRDALTRAQKARRG